MIIVNYQETTKKCQVLNQNAVARLLNVSSAIVSFAIRGEGYNRMDSPKIKLVQDWLRGIGFLVEDEVDDNQMAKADDDRIAA